MLYLATRAALGAGAFLLVGSGFVLLFLKPGTNEFVVTIVNMIMGGAMVGAGAACARLVSRRTTTKEDQ